MNRKNVTREIAFGAVCAALAYGLSWIKLFEMPMGGSITAFSFLPLILYAYAFGIWRGFIVGTAYGLLQLTQPFWIVHPVQFLLDYSLGFSCVCLAGLPPLRKKNYALLIGIAVVGIARFIVGTLSGIFFFWEYAGADALTWKNLGPITAYSSAYNATYVFVDIALVFGAALVLLLSASFKYLLRLMKGS